MARYANRAEWGADLIWSLMTPENRVLMTFQMSEFDRDVRKQKLREQHPEWCELEVMNEIMRFAFKVHSEPVPEWLEKKLQQRVKEWRANQTAWR